MLPDLPDSKLLGVLVWMLGGCFGAGVAAATARFTLAKVLKDLGGVANKVRAIETARAQEHLDFVLALHDMTPPDQPERRRAVLEMLRHHRRS